MKRIDPLGMTRFYYVACKNNPMTYYVSVDGTFSDGGDITVLNEFINANRDYLKLYYHKHEIWWDWKIVFCNAEIESLFHILFGEAYDRDGNIPRYNPDEDDLEEEEVWTDII